MIAMLSIIAGIIVGILALNSSYREFQIEHGSHMRSLVWSTDRNLSNFFNFNREELKDEALVVQYYSQAQILETLNHMDPIQEHLVDAIALFSDDTLVGCTNDRISRLSFNRDYSISAPCLASDSEGKVYVSFIEPVADSDYKLVSLIRIDHFFDKFIGKELTDNYWLALYNMEYGLCIQNDASQPFVRNIGYDSAIERDDGITIMAKSAKSNQILVGEYKFNSKSFRTGNFFMTALPSGLSDNGYLTIGISVETRQFARALHNSFIKTAICGALVLFGLIIIIINVRRRYRANLEMAANIKLLKERNDSMRQLLETSEEIAHQQRLVTIGTIASSVNHEFSNLLTPIMGYSLMAMEKAEDNEEVMDYLERIYHSSAKAKDLVARFLQLSRKKTSDESVDFSPDEILSNVEKMLRPSLPFNVNVVKQYNCPERCLYGHKHEIEQVIINLVLNAFQAMKNDGGTLKISTHRNDEYVEFALEDNGPGIPEEVQPRIFEPFFTTKDNDSGTGLGLSIVKQIVESHHGRIELESEFNKGTTFRIILPIYKPD